MVIEINKAYAKAFSCNKRYVHLFGGRGGAKSHSQAQKMIGRAMQPDYYRGVLMREVHASIRDSQFREIKDQIELYGLQPFFQLNETVCLRTNK